MIHTVYQDFDPKMLKTEEQILFAAMKVFSLFPLETATLRMIAKEAGVTLSLITYHFKSKENLYQEVIHRILAYVTRDIQEHCGAIEEIETLSRNAAQDMLQEVIFSFADRIYGNPNAGQYGQIIIREHFYPTAVYQEIYERYFKKILEILTRLVARITDNPDAHENTMQAFSILGQVMAVILERELMVKHLGMTGFSEQEIDSIKTLILRNVNAQLGLVEEETLTGVG